MPEKKDILARAFSLLRPLLKLCQKVDSPVVELAFKWESTGLLRDHKKAGLVSYAPVLSFKVWEGPDRSPFTSTLG